MSAAELIRAAHTEACHPFARHVLDEAAWTRLGGALDADPACELLAMWADTVRIHAIFRSGDEILPASVAVRGGHYPALSPYRPAAAWFERMIADLWGHRAEGGRDARPWLDHGKWLQTIPLSPKPEPRGGAADTPEFLAAEGEDLHQIAVGPIHAGIIEPGHFRFHASGETVVRLEIRLGYLHKGTLGLMRGKSPRAAARFASRLSGDSTVAHSIAFARAAEAASGTEAPPRAHALRAVMAEIERIANHIGDFGAITNDASFAYILARAGVHREAMLRAAAAAFGHRLMMDCVIPGGVAADIAPEGRVAILRATGELAGELGQLTRVYEDYSSLADRVVGTGQVAPDLLARFAAGGFIGRASGREFDVRRRPGYPPYDTLEFAVPVRHDGDVDARVRIRLDEIGESIKLLGVLLDSLPDGPVSVALPMASGEGIGWAEGFRGDIWHWIRLDGGLIGAVFMRDPSWLQWPLLEAAIRGNIVADFPLCNKSFNCSVLGSGSLMVWRRIATNLRHGPSTLPPVPADSATTRALAERLEAASRLRLGRSLSIRQVDAGSCNGCELEIQMLNSIVYDLERFGLRFVASPRHADVLMVTGPVTRNMQDALMRTWQAVPEPKWVVAVGDCAIDGGVFKGSYAITGGIDATLPVDLVVRGCPPTPAQLLDGLRALVEANA